MVSGENVFYVLPSGENAGQIRSAVIVNRHNISVVDIEVSTNSDDGEDWVGDTTVMKYVPHDAHNVPGTWHYPTENPDLD